jgi:hypothetical protein
MTTKILIGDFLTLFAPNGVEIAITHQNQSTLATCARGKKKTDLQDFWCLYISVIDLKRNFRV